MIWYLGKILYLWVRTTVQPKHLQTYLELKSQVPVLYALSHRALSDLLVLDQECKKAGLRRPRRYWRFFRKESEDAGYFYLDKLGLLAPQKMRNASPVPLVELLRKIKEDPEFNVQLVPVSIVWGRNPGRDDRYAWLRFLFTDDENAGILQKFLIVLIHGKNVAVHYGKSIWLRELVQDGLDHEIAAKKLRRVLRVHFRTQRNIMLGPKLYDRSRVIETLIASHPVQAAIEAEALSTGGQIPKIERKARVYLKEISSAQSHAVLGFFDIILSYLWNKKFSGQLIRHQDRLRAVASKSELIYAATHRSHFDYLLIGYVLYYLGMTVPHTGAGINLNFWPVGPLLRRGGAFFFWRSFRGNRLYTTVFTEYIHYLLTAGYSMTFFPEGGRSRTGRLLNPKTGMMAMIVHSFVRNQGRKPYVFVPVFIAYDRIPEIKSYLKELKGSSKTKENAWQLLRALKVLNKPFGRAYISYGDPIDLGQYLNSIQNDWKSVDATSEIKPKWISPIVEKLAQEVMVRTNNAAIIYPVSVIATILLANPQRAMVEAEVAVVVEHLKQLFGKCPYADDTLFIDKSFDEMILECEKIAPLSRAKDPTGDVLYAGEVDGVVLSYYRNTVLHCFAIPSMIASFFQHQESLAHVELVDAVEELYPFMQKELFLRFKDKVQIREFVERNIETMIQIGLLKRDPQDSTRLLRPDFEENSLLSLRIIARIIGHVFERYAIGALVLKRCFETKNTIMKPQFESLCQKYSYRSAVLGGINETEFYDKNLYQSFVGNLSSRDFVALSEYETLSPMPKIINLANCFRKLVSSELLASIERSSLKSNGDSNV